MTVHLTMSQSENKCIAFITYILINIDLIAVRHWVKIDYFKTKIYTYFDYFYILFYVSKH